MKNESDFGNTQIERYQSHLKTTAHTSNGLILLTRYPVPEEQVKKASGHIRWHQLGSKLQQLSVESQKDVHSQFILNQFLGLLYSRSILMTQVQRELEAGLLSLSSLFLMLSEACSAHKLDYSYEFPKPDWIGIRIKSKAKGVFHIGIEPGLSTLLQFGSWNQIEGLEEINKNGFTPYDKKGRVTAWCGYDFQKDDGRFFRLTPHEQYEELERFLRQSIDAYDRLPILKIVAW